MEKNYESQVNTSRIRTSSSRHSRSERQEIESDRGRVLFSAPLRRLQSKAQVFSLESNAAVRSRLTHSMEVSHVGRYIVQRIKQIAIEKNYSKLAEECDLIETIVETTCLLHDIGNPPFGHLGEKAIQEWFKENANKYHFLATEKTIDKNSSWYKDFLAFDGNPQGLRIVLNLQGNPGEKGFNLTLSQLATLIKYPATSTDKNKFNKIGVFTSEKKDVEYIWNKLDLDWGKRYPLMFLMEAADDIAYSLSDIEDGIEKRVINEREVLAQLHRIFTKRGLKDFAGLINDARKSTVTSPFVAFRTYMINKMVEQAANKFVVNWKDISAGEFDGIFCLDDNEEGDDCSKAINIINTYCSETLYRSAEAEDIEIAGYNIVHGLMDKFSILLQLDKDEFISLAKKGKGKALCRRMISKLPNSLVQHYLYAIETDEENEWFRRVQLIVDYISGMTDDFSLKVFRLIHGIKVEII